MVDRPHRARYRLRIALSGWLLLTSISAGAQEHEHLPLEQLGSVEFATSCHDIAAPAINRAVALLHSFQFSRAIEAFNSALHADPGCGVAYWGIALSDWGNPFAAGIKDVAQLRLGRDCVDKGRAVGAASERERAYIVAVGKLYENYESTRQQTRLLAYRDAMRRVSQRYPDDVEARIFYALAISAAEDPDDKSYSGRLQAGAMLEQMFVQQPLHPGLAHYIIHTYDVPPLADKALAAAKRYAQIAPDAPHALHMPSHTFTRLGLWQESIDSNIAAAAAARRQQQTAEELHASDYEEYAYLQTGQDQAAARIVDSLPEIGSRFDPRAVVGGAGPPSAGYFALAAIPARYALEREDWARAEALPVRAGPFAQADAMTWYARGLGAARLGHTAEASRAATELQSLQERLLKGDEPYWARQVEIQTLEVKAWTAFAAGRRRDALTQMNFAAALEDGTEKNAVTPGPLAPARELLGDMLLLDQRPAEALRQYEATLTKEPRRLRAFLGAAQAANQSGRPDLGRRYYRDVLSVCERADRPYRPALDSAARALQEAPAL